MMLIVGKNCPKCDIVKKNLPDDFENVFDVNDLEAVVELSMRDMSDLPLSLPILLLDEDDEFSFISGDAKRILDRIRRA